jgi:hypothetical protein
MKKPDQALASEIGPMEKSLYTSNGNIQADAMITLKNANRNLARLWGILTHIEMVFADIGNRRRSRPVRGHLNFSFWPEDPIVALQYSCTEFLPKMNFAS